MRIYIAGPMAGYPEDNYPAFQRAVDFLAGLGHDPVSPHLIEPLQHDGPCPPGPRGGSDHAAGCHLRPDIAALVTCDAIALLDGWSASAGARLELTVATQCGLPVYRVYPGAQRLDPMDHPPVASRQVRRFEALWRRSEIGELSASFRLEDGTRIYSTITELAGLTADDIYDLTLEALHASVRNYVPDDVEIVIDLSTDGWKSL